MIAGLGRWHVRCNLATCCCSCEILSRSMDCPDTNLKQGSAMKGAYSDWGLRGRLRRGDLLQHKEALGNHAAPSTGRMALFWGPGRRSSLNSLAICCAWGGCFICWRCVIVNLQRIYLGIHAFVCIAYQSSHRGIISEQEPQACTANPISLHAT